MNSLASVDCRNAIRGSLQSDHGETFKVYGAQLGGGIKLQIEAELHPRQRRIAINGSAPHSGSIEKWYPNASRKLRTVLNRGTFG
jgi:hypothetical protein